MIRFSANLGFLWTDRGLPEAIYMAKAAGFDAVECHWPYATPAQDIRAALDDTGLPLLGLNTIRGATGENGLAAVPGRETEARASIDQAIDYANAVGSEAIHVMAGVATGPDAYTTYQKNLAFACDQTDKIILIEPLNRHDAPGYFLKTTDQAKTIIEDLDRPNLRLMFDCYHVGRTEGDVTTRLTALLPIIGHIQCASVPDRGPPDRGELDYDVVFDHIASLGWNRPVGAEFKASGPDEITRWMKQARSAKAC